MNLLRINIAPSLAHLPAFRILITQASSLSAQVSQISV